MRDEELIDKIKQKIEELDEVKKIHAIGGKKDFLIYEDRLRLEAEVELTEEDSHV